MANITYISSQGATFNLLSFDYAKLEKANFHKVDWEPDTETKQFGERLKRFTKRALGYEVTFKFRGSPLQRKTQIDDFIYQTEWDIAHEKTGRIYWDNQYIECYFRKHDTHPEEDGNNYTVIVGIIYCPYPFWIEEQKVMIRPSESSVEGLPESVKRYAPCYGYPYAYPYAKTATYINVDTALESNFKAVIYGAVADHVQFYINSHLYKVNRSLRTNQIMIIDTRDTVPVDERCYVILENGHKENCFDDRDTNSKLFTKMPTGPIVINYDRTFGIDFYIFQERSAPK